MTHAAAGRFDHVHGDEDQGTYTAEEEAFIVHRADLLLAQRLNDRALFRDLLSGIDASEIEPHLQRAIINVLRPNLGRIEVDAITTAVYQIARIVKAEAEIVWTEQCRREAERQLEEES